MGWGFPFFNFAHLWQQLRTPPVWANLLPWIALFTATVFLLAVIYWTSTTRDDTTLSPESAAASETAASENSTGATPNAPNANNSAAIINSNVTPLPELPAPARDYMEEVIALPTWANVNVAENQPLLVREGPSTTFGFITTLQDGTAVSVVAFSDDGRWSQIRSPYEGWVNNDYLLFISDAATQPRITINVEPRHAPNYAVNVYAAPLADAFVIGTLTPGEFVVVAAATGDPVSWYQIAAPTSGWVAAQDLAPAAP
jgi:uncharacterized protein YgiM (DUF1202 family)